MNPFTFTRSKFINISILLLRLIVGLILFIVGSGKVLGWFGGAGLSQSLAFYTSLGIPTFYAYASIFTEFIGGFLLIIGFLTRFVAILAAMNMFAATFFSLPMGLLLTAFPFNLVIVLIAIFISGPLQYSIDNLIWPIDLEFKQRSKNIE